MLHVELRLGDPRAGRRQAGGLSEDGESGLIQTEYS